MAFNVALLSSPTLACKVTVFLWGLSLVYELLQCDFHLFVCALADVPYVYISSTPMCRGELPFIQNLTLSLLACMPMLLQNPVAMLGITVRLSKNICTYVCI